MTSVFLITRCEWHRQFVQPFAWTFIAAMTALSAYLFLLSLDAFLQLAPKLGGLKNAPGVTDLVAIPLLRTTANLLMLAIPIITMRSFAGERRAHTLPLLLAAGIGNGRIVLGKYFGTLGLIVLMIALICLMPLSLGFGTALDIGKLIAAITGLVLYASALTAIGIMCSAYTQQPALAAGSAVALSSLLAIVDAGARFQGIENSGINYLAIPTHLEPFFRGLLTSVDSVYFILIIAVALSLAARRLDTLRMQVD